MCMDCRCGLSCIYRRPCNRESSNEPGADPDPEPDGVGNGEHRARREICCLVVCSPYLAFTFCQRIKEMKNVLICLLPLVLFAACSTVERSRMPEDQTFSSYPIEDLTSLQFAEPI